MLIDINLMAKEQRASHWVEMEVTLERLSYHGVILSIKQTTHMREIIVNCDFCRIVLFTQLRQQTPAYPLLSIEEERHFFIEIATQKAGIADKYITEYFPLNSL